MVDSSSVRELEVLLAQLPGRMRDAQFAEAFLGRSKEISVWNDAVEISTLGIRYRAVKDRRAGYELTEGVRVVITPRQALLVVADRDNVYVKISLVDLAFQMTAAKVKLSAADSNARFAQMIASARNLLGE